MAIFCVASAARLLAALKHAAHDGFESMKNAAECPHVPALAALQLHTPPGSSL
jgi:hypothetical protein